MRLWRAWHCQRFPGGCPLPAAAATGQDICAIKWGRSAHAALQLAAPPTGHPLRAPPHLLEAGSQASLPSSDCRYVGSRAASASLQR